MVMSVRVSPKLIGLGLALGLATQLRIGPIGPGEVILSGIWLAAFGRILFRGRSYSQPIPTVYSMFILMTMCWGIVSLTAGILLQTAWSEWPRQYLAIGVAVTFAPLVYGAWGFETLTASLGTFSIINIALNGATWVLFQAGIQGLGPIEFYYGGARLMGLSSDPNQCALGLAIAMIGVLAVGRYRGLSVARRCAFAVIAFALGRATDSDSFYVASGSGLILSLGDWLYDKRNRFRPRVVMSLTILATTAAGYVVYRLFEDFDDLYNKGSQGETRVTLWRHGLEAWRRSPIFGNGPGHFSGLIAPFQGAESHNLYIDWLSAYGVFGFVSLIILFSSAFLRSIIARNFSGAGLLAVLSILSFFVFFARHPIFWVAVLWVQIRGFDGRRSMVIQNQAHWGRSSK